MPVFNNVLAGAAGQTGGAAAEYVIPKSLRFNSGDSAHLSKTPSSAGNRRKWTVSLWLKRTKLGTNNQHVLETASSPEYSGLWFAQDDSLEFRGFNGSSYTYRLHTSQKFRDPSAWYHIVLNFDSTASTSSDRLAMYVNGVKVTDFANTVYPSQNHESNWNNAVAHYIGSFDGSSNHYGGLIADLQSIDGQALQASDFAETRSSDGVWVPKEASFTSPNNGTTWSGSYTASNSFQSSAPATNGFDGSLSTRSACSTSGCTVTFAPSSAITVNTSLRVYAGYGSASVNSGSAVDFSGSALGWQDLSFTGSLTSLAVTGNSSGGNANAGEIYAVEIDGVILVDGAGKYGKNGFHLNFSDSSTNEALGYDSAATVPDLDPKKGMDVITYTGNNAARNIGGLAFEPGLVWIKDRDSANSHNISDSVRGPNASLFSNATNAETAGSSNPYLSAFNPDGFSIGNNTDINQLHNNFVAWTWRAGGAAVANTAGDVTSQVSANTDYGFSIVKWTNNGNNTPSSHRAGHGLGATPDLVITKRTNNTGDWAVYSEAFSNPVRNELYLNTTSAVATAGVDLYHRDSTTFGIRASSIGSSGDEHIAYCWKEVAGYSKISSYAGTGANGNKQTTGFKPRWVLIKGTDSTYDWQIFDSERTPSNPRNLNLEPNTSDAEATTGNNVSFHDDGFSFNTNSDKLNGSSKNYIYMCFADRPGNNWDVNNIVTNEGLTTSKTQFDVVTYTGNGGTQKIGGGATASEGVTATGTGGVSGISTTYPITGAFDGATSTYLATNAANISSNAAVLTVTFPSGNQPSYSSSVVLEVWAGTADTVKVAINGGAWQNVSASSSGWQSHTVATGSGTITEIKVSRQKGNTNNGAAELRAINVDGVQLLDGTGPGLKFQPDFVWLKSRTAANNHSLFDSVRGAPKGLHSNTTGAEFNDSSTLTAFNSDGFRLAGHAVTNANNQNYVAYCWKAGGAAASNSNGSITSSVSANAAYGFSIVSYVGTAANATVGHGLNSAPGMIIVKTRDTGYGWYVYHKGVASDAETDYLGLNTSNAAADSNVAWNDTKPTSSVFSIGSDGSVNESGDNMIAYCFADVPGYQRIGSYTGNGSSTGPVVVTGFKPRLVLIKRTDSTGNWFLYDNERGSEVVWADLADSASNGYAIEYLSNGFQPKNTSAGMNASNGNYIYLAIGDDEIGSDEDCLVDVPNAVTADADATDTTGGYQRGNYATLNPLMNADGQNITLANGNLSFTSAASSGQYGTRVNTIGVTSGKWYAEFTVGAVGNGVFIGITRDPDGDSNFIGGHATSYGYLTNGQKYNNNSGSSYGDSYTAGDVISIAMDLDNDTVAFYKNGVSQGTAYSSLAASTYFMGISGAVNAAVVANFGQMRFKYPIPSGYAALNTTALPAATIADGSSYFDVVTYTGDGNSTRTITNIGFSPDLVWTKARNQAYGQNWYDIVRTAGKVLRSDLTDAEATNHEHGYLSAFNSDGYTMSAGTTSSKNGNELNTTYVGWLWDAGSSTVSNTDGSITSQVRANQTAGFSIVKFTSTNTNNATVGHGLGVAPEFILIKNIDSSEFWWAIHKYMNNDPWNDSTLRLNTSDGTTGVYGTFNNVAPTNSVINLANTTTPAPNKGTDDKIMYCFAPVAGYSAIGSYTGNGSADGPFTFTGFKVRWVLIKNVSDSGKNWRIYDTAINPGNVMDRAISVNLSDAELTTSNLIDSLSNGFKCRGTSSFTNESGKTYIYVAFAENPFQANGGLAR